MIGRNSSGWMWHGCRPPIFSERRGDLPVCDFDVAGAVCMVRDISPAGGLLCLGNAPGVPDEFDLLMDGYSRRCVATWRRLDRVGVKFKSTATA